MPLRPLFSTFSPPLSFYLLGLLFVYGLSFFRCYLSRCGTSHCPESARNGTSLRIEECFQTDLECPLVSRNRGSLPYCTGKNLYSCTALSLEDRLLLVADRVVAPCRDVPPPHASAAQAHCGCVRFLFLLLLFIFLFPCGSSGTLL